MAQESSHRVVVIVDENSNPFGRRFGTGRSPAAGGPRAPAAVDA